MSSHPIEAMSLAAAEAITESLRDGVRDAARMDLVLESAGDLLRARLPLPAEIRDWIQRLSVDELAGAFVRGRERLEQASVPSTPEDIDALDVIVEARDRAESVTMAIKRACLGSGRFLVQIPGVEAALELQDDVDRLLGERVGRAGVERSLGLRAPLGEGWTSRIAPATDAHEGGPEAQMRWESTGLPRAARPSPATLVEYVQSGRHASIVERVAASDAAFAEELESVIGAFRDTAQVVGLIARRWQAAGSQERAEPERLGATVVPLGFEMRHAAASTASEAPIESVDLGCLHPTDAEGELRLAGTQLTLRVASRSPLRSVQLGTAHADTEVRPGVWEVATDASSEPLRLVVETQDGRRFETVVDLFARDPA